MKKLWGLIRNSPATCIADFFQALGLGTADPVCKVQKWAIFRGWGGFSYYTSHHAFGYTYGTTTPHGGWLFLLWVCFLWVMVCAEGEGGDFSGVS